MEEKRRPAVGAHFSILSSLVLVCEEMKIQSGCVFLWCGGSASITPWLFLGWIAFWIIPWLISHGCKLLAVCHPVKRGEGGGREKERGGKKNNNKERKAEEKGRQFVTKADDPGPWTCPGLSRTGLIPKVIKTSCISISFSFSFSSDFLLCVRGKRRKKCKAQKEVRAAVS